MTILKIMPFPRPKRWNLAEKWWTSYGVLSADPFQIEKLHQFKRNWILPQKTNEHWNDRIWPKNDDSPGESFPLTYFQSKSCTNLPQTEFWKKCRVGGRNDGIWPKNDQPVTESYLLTHFQSKSCTNLSETEFWPKKKNEHRNENF